MFLRLKRHGEHGPVQDVAIFTSVELYELTDLHISQPKTCPSSTHSPPCASQCSERSCPTNTELLLERLGSWEIKKRRLSTLELRQLFSAVEWGLAEMLHVCLQGTSVQGCSNERGVRAVILHCIPCF